LPPINPDAIHRTFSEETSPNWQQELQTVNAWVRRQPYFVDLYPHFTDEAGELPDHFAIDGLHYDISGKRLMGTLINANWDRLTR
jgi:lysophospholipase L1-like esterase